LFKKENYRRAKRTFAQGKYIDKTIEFGNPILQNKVVEYV